MLGKLFARLFSSASGEAPQPLPLHAESDLRDSLRARNVELDRQRSVAVLDAMRRGRKIDAIKQLREGAIPRLGLKESKEIIEDFQERLKSSPNDRFRR